MPASLLPHVRKRPAIDAPVATKAKDIILTLPKAMRVNATRETLSKDENQALIADLILELGGLTKACKHLDLHAPTVLFLTRNDDLFGKRILAARRAVRLAQLDEVSDLADAIVTENVKEQVSKTYLQSHIRTKLYELEFGKKDELSTTTITNNTIVITEEMRRSMIAAHQARQRNEILPDRSS